LPSLCDSAIRSSNASTSPSRKLASAPTARIAGGTAPPIE
jgi:hypothetical protein